MGIPGIQFQPRWKEELVCTSPMGSFVLEMPMGVVSVYFPTEPVWGKRAPKWAAPYWAEILSQLRAWCGSNGIALHVDDDAEVYEV